MWYPDFLDKSLEVFNASGENIGELITVKRGDNLSSIAKKYVGLSASQLKSWNKLHSSALKVGMRLKIFQR